MNAYQRAKERARNRALDFQFDFCNNNYSYEDLVCWQAYFQRIAKRYGLMEEFRENGII